MTDYAVDENQETQYVLAGTEEEQTVLSDSGSNHYTVLVSNIGLPGQGVPTGGTTGQVLKKASNTNYDTEWAADEAGTSAVWGAITGILSNQTDLQNALNAKENTGVAAAAVSGHEGALDPHPQYTSAAEAAAAAPVQSVAGKTGVVTLDKNDVGLGNVDNTSDLSKPISTATQAALDDIVDLVSYSFAGGF